MTVFTLRKKIFLVVTVMAFPILASANVVDNGPKMFQCDEDPIDTRLAYVGGLGLDNFFLRSRERNAQYQWFDCDTGIDIEGATRRKFTPSGDGAFAVRISREDGCEAVSECIRIPQLAGPECPVGDPEPPTIGLSEDGTLLTAAKEVSGTHYQWIDCNTGLPVAILGANRRGFRPPVNGSYAVNVSRPNGCSVTSECITVTLPQDVDLCELNPINTRLRVDQTGTTLWSREGWARYQWFRADDGTPIDGARRKGFTPSESGSYFVRTTRTDGCVVDSETVAVTIQGSSCVENPLEASVIVNQDGSVLKASERWAKYQWIDCDNGLDIYGAKSRNFVPPVPGNYKVRITRSDGCVAVSDCVSTNLDTNPIISMLVYPNPTASDGKFTISFDNDMTFPEINLKIFNSMGQEQPGGGTYLNTGEVESTIHGPTGNYTLAITIPSIGFTRGIIIMKGD